MTKSTPWIIAHRGARDEAPENTGAALRRAAELPIDGVEFDVQMSADGAVVLFHDWTLMKINRRRSRIPDLTRNDLERIDWGGWYGLRFSGEPLTTLQTAVSLLRDCRHICIEIKSHPADQASGHAYRLTQQVVGLLNEPGMGDIKDRARILSFDPKVLDTAHRLDAGLRLLLNLPERNPLKEEPGTDHLWAVGTRISNLSTPLVQWARLRNLKVFTYTCNGPRQVKKAIRAGADAIITDRPAWMVNHFRQTYPG